MMEDRRLTLAAKVEFLSRPSAYPEPIGEVSRRETHMSWVFLAGDKVFKLKKPVRFAYLDFSTLARREAMCRAELRLNRRLAPDVYLDVVPLVLSAQGLSIGGPGEVVDWLVVMRRLEEHWALDRAIEEGRVKSSQLDRLVTTLGKFYRHAARGITTSPAIVSFCSISASNCQQGWSEPLDVASTAFWTSALDA
jgi:aminoglycoside phosphotransferase family enzyme